MEGGAAGDETALFGIVGSPGCDGDGDDDDDEEEEEAQGLTMRALAGMGRSVFMRSRRSQNSARKSSVAMARMPVQAVFFLGAQVT